MADEGKQDEECPVRASAVVRDDAVVTALIRRCGVAVELAAIRGDLETADDMLAKIRDIVRADALPDGDEGSDRADRALEIADQYSQTDGDHHKAWVLDQMVRTLTGTKAAYNEFVREHMAGEDGPATYGWDTGTAP